MLIHHPPTIINAYLSSKIDEKFNGTLTNPFFPATPTDIDALTETFPDSNGRFAVYDRMFRMRRTPFPHIKEEQIMYYFYKYGDNAIENVIEITQLVQDLLDNEDESAQDINAWAEQYISNKEFVYGTARCLPVFFHSIKIYQLEETRDIIDFGTARTYAGNKIIIDHKYHKN